MFNLNFAFPTLYIGTAHNEHLNIVDLPKNVVHNVQYQPFSLRWDLYCYFREQFKGYFENSLNYSNPVFFKD